MKSKHKILKSEIKKRDKDNQISRKDSAVRRKKEKNKVTFLYSSYKQIHYPSLKL